MQMLYGVGGKKMDSTKVVCGAFHQSLVDCRDKGYLSFLHHALSFYHIGLCIAAVDPAKWKIYTQAGYQCLFDVLGKTQL